MPYIVLDCLKRPASDAVVITAQMSVEPLFVQKRILGATADERRAALRISVFDDIVIVDHLQRGIVAPDHLRDQFNRFCAVADAKFRPNILHRRNLLHCRHLVELGKFRKCLPAILAVAICAGLPRFHIQCHPVAIFHAACLQHRQYDIIFEMLVKLLAGREELRTYLFLVMRILVACDGKASSDFSQ